MQQQGIGRLVVIDDGDLVGLISRTDLMTALNVIRTSGSIETAKRAADNREPDRSPPSGSQDRTPDPDADRQWD
jgi:hypothetical protein